MSEHATVRVELGARAYDILVGPHLLAEAGSHIRPLLRQPRVIVVTDETVAVLHLDALEASLAAAGVKTERIVLPPGEKTKDFAHLQALVDRLLDLGEGISMVSFGYSNRTPWHTPRELDDDELGRRLDKLAAQVSRPERAIFNFHVPPARTAIDKAPALDDSLKPVVKGGAVMMKSVGSEAVRRVRPWGVDVSSGVEAAKGIKDAAKIAAFIEEVLNADA